MSGTIIDFEPLTVRTNFGKETLINDSRILLRSPPFKQEIKTQTDKNLSSFNQPLSKIQNKFNPYALKPFARPTKTDARNSTKKKQLFPKRGSVPILSANERDEKGKDLLISQRAAYTRKNQKNPYIGVIEQNFLHNYSKSNRTTNQVSYSTGIKIPSPINFKTGLAASDESKNGDQMLSKSTQHAKEDVMRSYITYDKFYKDVNFSEAILVEQ